MGASKFINRNMDAIKPMKIARPPMRGMGWSCIRRLSLGTSTAPYFTASTFTRGVATQETIAADSRASRRYQMSSDAKIFVKSFK